MKMKEMKQKWVIYIIITLLPLWVSAQDQFNGLEMHLGKLFELSDATTRSISPENFTGEKGKGAMAVPEDRNIPNQANGGLAARDLGQGWKVNPFIKIKPGEIFTLADIEGPGAIQHIWMTPSKSWRFLILRIYWDDEKEPSVECPVGDFFGMGWDEYAPLNSLAVCVNPGSGFNCYWVMPFRKRCRITVENITDTGIKHPVPGESEIQSRMVSRSDISLYYQIDYTLTEIPGNAGYFHAQFRRTNPNMTSVYTIADHIKGKGQFIGVYMAWGLTNNDWWGEGEIKFYLDGDKEFPTICGTGTEDYFCGSYCFLNEDQEYEEFCTPYAGMHQVIRPDGVYKSEQRFGLYRWHIMDPVRFEKDLRISIQDLGWRHGGRYLQQHSDISSVCFWYQAEPHSKFPEFPDWMKLEIN